MPPFTHDGAFGQQEHGAAWRAGVTRDAFVLFTHRRYVLRANDRVEIWRDGRKYEGRSADSMTYPTHAQTAVYVRKVVTNS